MCMRGGIFLKSDDEMDREKGFEYEKGIRRYMLFVTPEEIERYLGRNILCKYRGYKCFILSEEGDAYRLLLQDCPPDERNTEYIRTSGEARI